MTRHLLTSAEFLEDELKAGRELKLRNMLNFDAFELVEELPPGKHAYDMVWVDEWQGDRVRSRLCVRQLKAEGLRDDLFAAERQTRLSSSICWPKLRVARISDNSLFDISVACDKVVTNALFQPNDRKSVYVQTKGFVVMWTWNSTATIFLVFGLPSNWEVCWQMNSKIISWHRRLKL